MPVYADGNFSANDTFGIPINVITNTSQPYNCDVCAAPRRFWGVSAHISDMIFVGAMVACCIQTTPSEADACSCARVCRELVAKTCMCRAAPACIAVRDSGAGLGGYPNGLQPRQHD